MSARIIKQIANDLRSILRLFIEKNYSALERKTGGVRLSAADIESAVRRYGRTLTFPPAQMFEGLDVIEVDRSNPKRYSLRFEFWTEEEGQSDLTLEATIVQDGGVLRWEIDNIHTL